MTSRETSGDNPACQFAGAGKMLIFGKGGQCEVDDSQIFRFAC